MYVGKLLWPLMLLVVARDASALALALATLLGWGLALLALNSRRAFRPPNKAPLHFRDYVWEGRADWLGILFGNYRGAVKSAAGTLLLGAPDGFAGRFFLMLNLVFISPVLGMTALYMTGFADISDNAAAWAGTFLIFSLFTSLMSGLGNGELAARCRLVWLRQHGSRIEQWRQLERRLFADTTLLALIVIPITGVALLMFDSIAFDPLTYCVTALACNVLGNYSSIAARLSQWSLLLQLLINVAMGAALIGGSIGGLLPLPLIVALILGLALLFRQLALQRFAVVDWYQLRPASHSFKGKLS
jgi:hypothetical protein